MLEKRLDEILERLKELSVGVIGDFCVDAYWLIDNTNVEYSIETGKLTHAVRKQQYSLGGAGNVVSNLAALDVGRIHTFGVIGNDVFGREMLDLFDRLIRVDASGMIVQDDGWDTPVYAKPYIDLDEQERVDFGRFNHISPDTEHRLLERLQHALPRLDALIINQQLKQGIHTGSFIERLNELTSRYPDKIFLLDARDRAEGFENVICKLNAAEAARLCGHEREVSRAVTEDELKQYARQIFSNTGRAVIITRSDRGILAYDGGEFCLVPGILVIGQTDPVGAGDTTAAAVTAALAARATLAEAVELGNFAASVVVRKLRQTGTASPEDVRKAASDCQFVFRPELAEDIRKAHYHDSSEIELVGDEFSFRAVSHVIFDHDGTLSTLRQGWESIMEPVMVRAILGEQYEEASEELYQRVVRRVRDYIDQSTGVETIVQMEALVEMVRQFGLVPPGRVLDAPGYKALYNRALMNMVSERLEKLRSGRLDVTDFTIKGAVRFIRRLHDMGITLYLASGTDHADVVAEAQALGYAHYFSGGVYGWAGLGTGSAKKMVIERILKEHGLTGPNFACIGDGPVELRLAKRYGGVALGVASDELRRWGLNPEKRTRLIKAGADLLIPDYSQADLLVDVLFSS